MAYLNYKQKKGVLTMNNLFTMNDITSQFDPQEAQDGKALGILSYLIGLFVLIPYFTEKKNSWVRFHAVQALNLYIICAAATIAISILTSIFGLIPYIGIVFTILLGIVGFAVSICTFILIVLGIIHTAKGQAVEFPVIKNIKIIKK